MFNTIVSCYPKIQTRTFLQEDGMCILVGLPQDFEGIFKQITQMGNPLHENPLCGNRCYRSFFLMQCILVDRPILRFGRPFETNYTLWEYPLC